MSGVVYYVTEAGQEPFKDWFNSLEAKSRQVVNRYIDRVAHGGSRKNVASLGEGIWEIKIGYKAMRVYFGKINGLLILLGGGKGRQGDDIEQARYYWRCYGEQK